MLNSLEKWIYLMGALLFHFSENGLAADQNSCTACEFPDLPFNGTYKPRVMKFCLGDVVKYTCDKGFYLNGQEESKCILNGKWSASTPFCDMSSKIQSSYFQNIADGNFNTCSVSNKSTTDHSLDVYLDKPAIVDSIRLYLKMESCTISVFSVKNKNEIKCATDETSEDNNKWVTLKCKENQPITSSIRIKIEFEKPKNFNVCEIVVFTRNDFWCEKPPDLPVPYGYFEVSRSLASLHCEKGYKGENERVICENNVWKFNKPRCEEILCSSKINNSLETQNQWILIEKVSKFSAGTKRRLKCDPSFETSGSPQIITCLQNGSWSYTTAACIEERKGIPVSAIACGVVAMIIILSLLGVTAYLIKRKHSKEVVVVFKPGSVATGSDMDYAIPTYYESFQTPPILPDTPRPVRAINLNEEYELPHDCLLQPKLNIKPGPLPNNVDFEALKRSPIYKG